MLNKMCPFSGAMQFFIMLLTIVLTRHRFLVRAEMVETTENDVTVLMDTVHYINYSVNVRGADPSYPLYLKLNSENTKIANPLNSTIELTQETTNGSFGVSGIFLGKTVIKLSVEGVEDSESTYSINVKVVRPKRVIDTVFTATVATLVSIIYVNFGCALNWGEVCTTLKKPIGPAIGFVGQFLFMPLISFGLGKLLFPDDPAMQLGLFFTGISPGGGASNVWVAVLNGNINLSITMTTISTFGAFAMMPLWLFTLGRVIFEQANIGVPYRQISTYAIALVIPLLIGYLLQRFVKKVAHFFVRILKGFSALLILFIVIFAIVSNLYLFKIFSWQIVVGGMGLPWLGYVLAYLLAKLFKRSKEICLTIAVETGIQNTGIAIFLLRFALPQPEADITTVIPVYVASMTPIPLLILFLYQKISARFSASNEKTALLNTDEVKKSKHSDDLFTVSKDNSTSLTDL